MEREKIGLESKLKNLDAENNEKNRIISDLENLLKQKQNSLNKKLDADNEKDLLKKKND